MHPRRRNAGDGIRSSSARSSLSYPRVSSEGSFRGRRVYNSDYRNLSRSFGRTSSKPYPPLPLRRADILMEAGRLAAEYLVSQGLLPSIALQGKCQNSNLREIQDVKFQESRMYLKENDMMPCEDRSPVFSRVGIVPDVGSARRRLSNDFSSMRHRNQLRGRKKMGSLSGIGPNYRRENEKKGHWLEKIKAFPDSECEDDFVGVRCEGEQNDSFDAGARNLKAITNQHTLKSKIVDESEIKIETTNSLHYAGSKANSFSSSKAVTPETDAELNKRLDDATALNFNSKEVNGATISDKMEKDVQEEKNYSIKHELLANHGGYLLQLCRFAKVPSKPRSVASKVSRAKRCLVSEERSASDVAPVTGNDIQHQKSVAMEGESSGASTCISKSLELDVYSVPSVESLGIAVHMDTVDKNGKKTEPQLLLDCCSSVHGEESSDDPPGFEKREPVVLSKENVCYTHHLDVWEANREAAKSPSSGVSQCGEDHLLQDMSAEKLREVDNLSPDQEMVELICDKMPSEDGLTPKDGAAPDSEFRDEKQISLSSFKIFDLNLIDASEIAESLDGLTQNHVSKADASLGVEREASKNVVMPINDVQSASLSQFDDCHGLMNDSKEPMVVDAANDSLIDDKVFDASLQKTETVYPSLDSFLNHSENVVGLPDVQDGFSNAISHLLGNDLNCSAVSSGIDELHTRLSLHSHEGILGEDDPIFLPLGEIPFSMSGFLGVWDPPGQDYGRLF